jgi:hypothetical protein
VVRKLRWGISRDGLFTDSEGVKRENRRKLELEKAAVRT